MRILQQYVLRFVSSVYCCIIFCKFKHFNYQLILISGEKLITLAADDWIVKVMMQLNFIKWKSYSIQRDKLTSFDNSNYFVSSNEWYKILLIVGIKKKRKQTILYWDLMIEKMIYHTWNTREADDSHAHVVRESLIDHVSQTI